MKKSSLIIVVAAAAFGIALVLYFALPANSPDKNYQLAQKAFNDRQPSECGQIRGDSYTIDSSGTHVKISQKTARSICIDNINHGSTHNVFTGN